MTASAQNWISAVPVSICRLADKLLTSPFPRKRAVDGGKRSFFWHIALVIGFAALLAGDVHAADNASQSAPSSLMRPAQNFDDDGLRAGLDNPGVFGKSDIFTLQVDALTWELGLGRGKDETAAGDCPPNQLCEALPDIRLAQWLHRNAPAGQSLLSTSEGLRLFLPVAITDGGADEREATRADAAAGTSPPAPAAAPAAITKPRITPAERVPPDTPSRWSFWPWLIAVPLALAGIVVAVMVLRKRGRMGEVTELLNYFFRRVDLAKQHFVHDPRAIDGEVLEAFEQLHQNMCALLSSRRIRIEDVRNEVLRFHSPEQAASAEWSPPTLSQMGYVLAAADTFAHDCAALALYKYSGEERTRTGKVVDTYTILKEGSSDAFSSAFAAKVQSPFEIPLRVPAMPAAKPAVAPPPAVDHAAAPDEALSGDDCNVSFVLSLVANDDATSIDRFAANLEALQRPDKAHAPRGRLSPLSLRLHLHALLTEDLTARDADLAAAAAALMQSPQQVIAALAAMTHRQALDDTRLASFVTQLADTLTQRNAARFHGSEPRLMSLARIAGALPTLADNQLLRNSGATYVEARGAEADARFLRRLAQLVTPAEQVPTPDGAAPIVVTQLTAPAMGSMLREFSALMPGEAFQNAIDALIAAIDGGRVALHTVNHAVPLNVREVLHAHGARGGHPLVVAADPALTILEGMPETLHYVLWTLTGEALVAAGDTGAELALAAHGFAALPASATATRQQDATPMEFFPRLGETDVRG